MEQSFSQRMGLAALPESLKPEAMPPALRNSLWNAVYKWLPPTDDSKLIKALWDEFWKKPLDTIPFKRFGPRIDYSLAWSDVRTEFFTAEWNGVYDILEFFFPRNRFQGFSLPNEVNSVLTRELAAYRVIDNRIVPITSSEEINAIEIALSSTDKFAPTSEHFRTALALLADRDKPVYRNSIKESISAVESMAKIVSGKDKATLGDALSALERSGKLHKSLKNGYSALYGWTNDAEGIRHALMDEPNLTAADAKYFLIACAAFANYLKTLS